jgi:hypothetical protein
LQLIDNQAFWKHKVLPFKSIAFGHQKDSFWSVKGDVLEDKSYAFAMRNA